MTTSELKQQVDKVLGNSIRCLLPSYWWKRLFHQVADRIDEVEQSVESKADKSYVDEAVGNVKVDITIDSELSDTSNNPVQNKAIYAEFAKKQDVLVSGTTIKTINGKKILGSGDLQIAEAPGVLLTDDARSVAFIQAHLELLGGEQSYTLRGFVPFITANTEGEPTGYDFCEVNTTKIYVVSEGVYGYLEFSYNGSIYRRTYKMDTGSLVDEEIIASSSVTVPIVNSEEELINNYSSTDVAAAKVLELVSVRDLDEAMPVKSLRFEPTFNLTPTNGQGYIVLGNKDNTRNIIIAVGKDVGIMTAVVIFDEGTEYESFARLYEGGKLVSSTVLEINKFFSENEVIFKSCYPGGGATQEELYTYFDTFVKVQDDKGLANYVNGKITYLATKEEVTNLQNEVIANEEVTAAAFNEINERIEQLSENVSGAAATKEELNNAVETINNTIIENEEISAAALNELNERVVTPYEYYKGKGGVVSESAYNIMTKYLFTPFIISNNSTTTIPDELLNESQTSFFTDYYWNFMRLTGGEPIRTTQWANNVPQKFVGISSGLSFVIDFSNKTITPEQ